MSNNPTDLQEEEKEKPQTTSDDAQSQSETPQGDAGTTEAVEKPQESVSADIANSADTANAPNTANAPDTASAPEAKSPEVDLQTPADESSNVESSSSNEGSQVAGHEPADASDAESVSDVDSSVQSETVETEGSSESAATSDSNTTDEDSSGKPKIKIGSQRQEGSEEVLVPKAVKDAKETTIPIANQEVTAEPVEVGPSVEDLGSQWEKEAEAVLSADNMGELMNSAAVGESHELAVNTRIKGTVTKVHGESVFFLLKGQFDGVVPAKQFKKEPEPGTMTDVVVNGFNSDDNLYELSLPGAAISVGDWSDLEVGKLIEVRITGSNTGGLECSVNNIRGFIPASQIDISRVDNLGAFINQSMECVITEANKKKKNLVLSRRAILEKELKERKKEILDQFEVGSILDGKISKLREFGAFVNLGNGVEGLVHISKCSWHHIKHPSEVFEEGQDVTVRIEKVNKETGKIQLSHRDTVEHPWKRVTDKYPVDSTVKGSVSKIADFGAFIKLETGVEGLVHISEIAHERVKSVGAVLNEGQEVEVKILSVDPDKQKMSLSIKALLPVPVKEAQPEKPAESKEPPREMAVKKRNKPLKGGTSESSGGNQFGLKW